MRLSQRVQTIITAVSGPTCELLLAAISDTGFQVLQLDLHLLVVSHGLLALPPVKSQQTIDLTIT